MKELNEISVAVVGSVDSGKSTLIGTIISNKLDDGNGLNRSIVSFHNHEIKSGKTSSISVHSLKNYQNNNSVILIDLCGHEKYLKTTLYGIMGYFPDYAIVIVGANRGILKMTREHTKILHHLKMPIILVVTKIDLIEKLCIDSNSDYDDMLNKLTNDIKKIYSKGNYNVYDMNNCDEFIVPNNNTIPLFKLSCKTGVGLDLFKNYISKLPKNKEIIISPLIEKLVNKKPNTNYFIFYDEKIYNPPGIGLVVSGILKCSSLDDGVKINSQLFLGPGNSSNSTKNTTDFIQVKVWSIYNYYNEKIDKLYNGQKGCLAIRSDKKLNKELFRKGSILTNNIDIIKYASYKYKASIKLLSHPSNVKDNFTPVIHCSTIRQSASIKIINVKNKNTNDTNDTDYNENKCIYPGDTAIVIIEFKYYPEIIEPNELFFLREGLTLGIGTIIEPL
jgi:elongation factor 1-alpha